jgi:MFS family permease
MKKKVISKTDRTLIILISAIGFFGIFSTTMSKNPVLPLLSKSLNADEAVIGLIAAISPMAGIILSFPVGFLADRLSKKKLLVCSAAIFTAAPLLYLLITNAWFLIPVRFFHGMATAILGPVASAIICDAYPESKGEKLGLYSSVTLVGRTIAPLLGGVIISYFVFLHASWNFKAVYVAAFIIALPVLIFASLIRENGTTAIKKISISDFFSALGTFLTEKRLLGTSFVEMATYFTFGAFETYLPIYCNSINFPAYLIGIIFSIQVLSIALTKPFFGRLSDRIDRRIQIALGIFVLGASSVFIPFFTNPAAIVAVSIIFGLGMSLVTVATSTYAADVTAKNNLGSSMGALSAIMDIGHSSGPFVVGVVISAFASTRLQPDYTIGFLVCFGVCLLSAIVFTATSYSGKRS